MLTPTARPTTESRDAAARLTHPFLSCGFGVERRTTTFCPSRPAGVHRWPPSCPGVLTGAPAGNAACSD